MTMLKPTSWTLCRPHKPRPVACTHGGRHHICLLLTDGELCMAPIAKNPMVRRAQYMVYALVLIVAFYPACLRPGNWHWYATAATRTSIFID